MAILLTPNTNCSCAAVKKNKTKNPSYWGFNLYFHLSLRGGTLPYFYFRTEYCEYFSHLCCLPSGANVNVGKGADTPLHAAAWRDSLDQVVTLLDFGADVNLRDANNQRALQLAPPGGRTQSLLKSFEGIGRCSITSSCCPWQ